MVVFMDFFAVLLEAKPFFTSVTVPTSLFPTMIATSKG